MTADGTRTPVRTYDGGPLPVSGGVALLFDYEAPTGQPISYTADGTGVTGSATVTLSADKVWLVHPGIPVLSQPVEVAEFGDREYDVNQAVRYPLGRQYPIVATDGRRKAATYPLTVLTRTLDNLGDLEELLADAAPLLVSVPTGRNWGQVTEYVQVGQVTQGRVTRLAGEVYRRWTLPCTVVDRPPGGSQAEITYDVSYAAYPTYTARHAAHATYGAALEP